MQTSKEIFIPQTYDEYLRAVHSALVDAGVEMHQRTKKCGKFATKEGGGQRGYTRQRRDCNSVWSCPICRERIIDKYREKYNQICWDHLSHGGRTLLITFNPHRDKGKKESLVNQYQRFSNAMRYLREREPWKEKLKSKLGHVKNYRRNEISFSEGPSYHIHSHVVYLCENHSVSTDEIENDLHELWNEACRKNGFGWSKKGVGVNVREGENVGIYGLKKEHSLEDFENVKKMLDELKKRTARKFLKKDSYSIGDLERNIFSIKNGIYSNIFDLDETNDLLSAYNETFYGKKYLV